MIKYLFLDLDNTVLDFTTAEYHALRKTLAAFGLTPDEQVCSRYRQINIAHWERLERKELTREQVIFGRFAALFREFSLEADAVAVARAYEDNLIEYCCFLPGAQEALRHLSARYPLYLVTNGTAHVQWPKLEKAGIRQYFREIFISEEVGFDKPDPEFFRRCFARIEGFDPACAMIAGDSLTSDIQGGINAGIATCWVNTLRQPPRADICPDYEVDCLADLLPILEKK